MQNRREIRQIKQDNKFLKKENLDLKEQNGLLLEKVANRDSLVKRSMLTMDSLKITLQELNKHNIVKVYENYHTVTTLDLDGQIDLLTRFISSAEDSI